MQDSEGSTPTSPPDKGLIMAVAVTYITCEYCGKVCCKRASEVKRRNKLGQKDFYCNRICFGKNNNKHSRQYDGIFNNNLKFGSETDILSNFRPHISAIKRRSNNIDFGLNELKTLWEKQNGRCAVTGVEMAHRNWTEKVKPHTASVDRIEGNKPYTLDNIQFVCYSYNMAKNTFTDDETIKWLRSISWKN